MKFDIYDKSFYNMHLQWKPYYKMISEWILNQCEFETSIEYGFGNGFLSEFLKEAGKNISCSDFSKESVNFIDSSIRPFFSNIDMTVSIVTPDKKDLALCFEVAEHINPEGTEVFFDNLVSSDPKYILFSSEPTTNGHGHINCHPEEFWMTNICKKGYSLNKEKTYSFRNELDPKIQPISWYPNNFLFFDKLFIF
ncbi:hypothetical protein GW796_09280 [archaeon]|nr:hypothetical protein [archaeon]NCT58920.1 hypothetical protein [archaeon]